MAKSPNDVRPAPLNDIKQASRRAGAGTNGSAEIAAQTAGLKDSTNSAPQADPELLKKLTTIRTKAHEVFGRVVLAMITSSRYRHISILDLQSMVLEPLMRDRIAFAQPKLLDGTVDENGAVGMAIWANVSSEVDEKIREQIKAGVFPLHLKPDDWTSGEINWLLDVIAPDAKLTTAVIANFRQVIKQGEMRIHPVVARMVDSEDLKKMGLGPMAATEANAAK